MPFTFAHPAIIFPLRKYAGKYVSFTALIIGSMLPDFEYFIRMHLSSEHSHTLAGVFYFDLPLGILLAFIFHNVIRNCLIDNLPRILQGCMTEIKAFDWNKYFLNNKVVVISSFLIGIGSHILWDSFTHESGFFVEKISVFSYVINYKSLQIPVYKILQHGSTLIGLSYIILYIMRKPISTTEVNKVSIEYWICWLSITGGVLLIWTLYQNKIYIGHFIAASISASWISLTLTSIIWKYFRKKSYILQKK